MRPRTASRLAWTLWAVSIAAMVPAVVFLVLSWSSPRPPGEFGRPGFLEAMTLVFGTVGVVVASRRRENPIGWIFLGTAIGTATQGFANSYAIWGFSRTAPGATWAAWLIEWTWIPITGSLVVVFLLFPNGRLLSPRWRFAMTFAVAAITLSSVANALVPELTNAAEIPNPLGRTPSAFRDLAEVSLSLYVAALLVGSLSLIIRYRRSSSEERQQLKWLALAAAFVTLVIGVFAFGSALLGSDLSTAGQGADWLEDLTIVSFLSVPVSIGIAILKYRLYDVDIVISRAVVYGMLAAFITAVYVGIVVGVGAVVGSGGDVVLSAVAAAVVALAFQPLRRRAQHVANRLVYGKRATPYEVLSSFGERVAGAYSIQDILPRMARMLVEATGAERGDVWLSSGSELRPAASWPSDAPALGAAPLIGDELRDVPGADAAAAVRHQGELLGGLSLAKRSGDPVTPAEEKLLSDLASQAGLVLRNVRLVEELRASRKRIVAAQDERAKALERNIHDGAQQQLVALAVKLRLATSLARRDPAKTQAMLEELQAEAGDAMENLRDLARGIYPPLLADKGLAEALDAHARRAPIPVAVESDGTGRYPQEVETAAYFCTLEALQNVSKYAEASHATIRLREANGHLVFTVRDDGVGFDPTITRFGSGLTNIRDRLEALGGALEIASAPGKGTTITGRIPALQRDGAT